MSLIRPGIHENLVILPKTKINEHGTLELVIAAKQADDAELAAFESNVVSIAMESNLRFYPPNLTDFDKNVKSSADLGQDLRRMRYQLMQYALLFGSADVVNNYIGGTTMFDGLGIAPNEYGKAIKMLTNEDFLNKVCTNLQSKFVQFLNDSGAFTGAISFRQKFLRQSKDKNYAVTPSSDFDVWIEPMTITKDKSQIAFTQWEIDNGKNDPNPSASSDKANTTKEDANTGKDLFGATPSAAAPASIAPVSGIKNTGLAQPPVGQIPTGQVARNTASTLTGQVADVVITPVPATPASASGFFNTPAPQ